MAKTKKKAKRNFYIAVFVLLLAIILGSAVLILRYAPTSETMPLSEYFVKNTPDESAVILNGEYDEPAEGETPRAIVQNGGTYIELSYLKANLDDGYVYDASENILRYVTDTDVITVTLGSTDYAVNKDAASKGRNVLVSAYDTVYILTDFITDYTDVNFTTAAEPDRVMIETAGWEKTVSTVKKNKVALRRFGGNKSKILAEANKGDTVTVLEDYGKWSLVLTADGVRGCLRNKQLSDLSTETVPSHLSARSYQHLSLNGKVKIIWDQVWQGNGNANIASTVAAAPGINVIVPTWMSLANDFGEIRSYASMDYVSYCHSQGILVWGLVNNIDIPGIDTATVLNTTSSRDNLVNNLVAQAIAYDMDGINVDFEGLSVTAKDGYIEFLRELSLKCEKNDLYLSTDEAVPSSFSSFHNRAEQAKYVDYVIVMAYDEHYGDGSASGAGSVASIGFVTDAVEGTLLEVPAEQTVLGVPFYTKFWATDANGALSAQSSSMTNAKNYFAEAGVTPVWDEATGQYYAEYKSESGTLTQCWLEEEKSIDLKMRVMSDNHLAGAAFWSTSWSVPDEVWNTIAKYVN